MLSNTAKWAANIKAEMKKKNITISGLARDLHYTRGYVSAIVNGRIFAPQAMARITQRVKSSPISSTTEEERRQAEILSLFNEMLAQ